MPNTILFKKTAEFELTFEDFFERFYDVGEEDEARRVFEAMSNVTTDDAEGDEGFDFFLCQIEQAKEEAEEDLEAKKEEHGGDCLCGKCCPSCEDCSKHPDECECDDDEEEEDLDAMTERCGSCGTKNAVSKKMIDRNYHNCGDCERR